MSSRAAHAACIQSFVENIMGELFSWLGRSVLYFFLPWLRMQR